MATRFYLPAGTGTAPPVSPAIDGAIWEHVNTSRRLMRTTKQGTAIATTAYAPDAADDLTDKDSHFVQFISDFLEAQTISGTWKLQVRAAEDNAGNNLLLAVRVYVVSGDGGTIRATLQAITRDVGEVNTALRNKSMSGSISSYTCIRGDRLVFEFGLGGTPTAAGGVQGHNGSLSFGDPFTTADLPEDETTTTASCPWFEFSGTVQISPFDATINGFEQGWPHVLFGSGAVMSQDAASIHSGDWGFKVTAPADTTLHYSGVCASFDATGDLVNSNVPGVWDTGYIKVHARPATLSEPIYYLMAAIARRAEIWLTPAGELALGNNSGTILGTLTTVLALETWYRVDVKVHGTTTSDGVWELRLSDDVTGALIESISGTGANFGTANHATGYGGKFVNRNSQGYTVSYDDWVRCIGDFAPAGVLNIVRPQSDGTSGAGWDDAGSTGSSAASELQDEPAGPAGDSTDTTMWVSTTASEERLLTFETLAAAGYADSAISRIVTCQAGVRIRDVGGASSVGVRMQVNGVNKDGTLHDPGDSYIGRFVFAEYAIDTGGLWTPTTVNAILFGPYKGTNIEVRATVAKLEVLIVKAGFDAATLQHYAPTLPVFSKGAVAY